MRLPLGSTPAGAPVVVDTATLGVLCLVGDPGRGKTTLARHLLRWWLAGRSHACRVLAEDPHQYADLPVTHLPLGHLSVTRPPVTHLPVAHLPVAHPAGFDLAAAGSGLASMTVSTGPRCWLTVVDGADAAPLAVVRRLVLAGGPLVVTSYGPAARSIAAEAPDCVCLGLLPRPPQVKGPTPARSRSAPAGADVDQGRLDWPCEVVHLVPGRRGEVDFPRHRWHLLVGEVAG